MIVQVGLDLPLDRLFDYDCPDASEQDLGRRVTVPFGRGVRMGVILGCTEGTAIPVDRLKTVHQLWRDVPALDEDDRRLLRFCSEYYHYPLGSTILNALPPALKKSKGWRPPKRRKSSTVCTTRDSRTELNAEQRRIVDSVTTGRGFVATLLFGVTGSGKTDVYLELIDRVLAAGGQVLVLVPEINLTPQLEQRFRQRFPDIPWISLHSGLGAGERAARWLEAQSGQARVVLGTRLAVFCPMPELGLIVVDEEHESSFRQQDGLRYSARDVAVVRARQRDIPILLGSATPSLESWHNARTGRYNILTLMQRAHPDARLPSIHLVDPGPLPQSLPPVVLDALKERLERGEQSLVFLNRRGYAPVLRCSQCGWQAGCRHCDARLVVHLADRELRCHHCGARERLVLACPECGNADLKAWGDGTQRIEMLLREQLPEARIARLDGDTLAGYKDWESARRRVLGGEIDILVGTQMLIKGHDFPNLTLVLALNVDASLYSADFRAQERLFAQLVQVAGRAGRQGCGGEVWIQTALACHPLLTAVQNQQIALFLDQSLVERQQGHWPPFTHLAMLRVDSAEAAETRHFIEAATDLAKLCNHPSMVEVYEPVPALMAQKAGRHRWQLLVQSHRRQALQQFIRRWRVELERQRTPRALNWLVEIDPVDV